MAGAREIPIILYGVDRVSGVLKSVGGDFEKMAYKMQSLGRGLTYAVTLPIAAIGAAAVKTAVEFDTAMRNIQSVGQQTDAEIKTLGQTFQTMSQDITKTTQPAGELAKSFFFIQGSGFAGAEGLKVLEASTKAATAGITTTDVAAKAIIATLNAYGLGASEATHVSDVLFRTVDRGVVTFEELSQQWGDVVNTAAAAKVRIEVLGAAIATITKTGINAAEAVTGLNQLLLSFVSPSKEAQKAAAELGLTLNTQMIQGDNLVKTMKELAEKTGLVKVASQLEKDARIQAIDAQIKDLQARRGAMELSREQSAALSSQVKLLKEQRSEIESQIFDTLDYTGALQQMNQATGVSVEALAALFPNVRALRAALALAREEARPFAEDLAAMNQAGGRTASAFAIQTAGFAAQLAIFRNSLNVLLQTIGEQLLPALTNFTNSLIPLIQKFAQLPQPVQQNVVQFGLLAAAAGPLASGLGIVLGILGKIAPVLISVASKILTLNPYVLAATVAIALLSAKFQESGGSITGSATNINNVVKAQFGSIGTEIGKMGAALGEFGSALSDYVSKTADALGISDAFAKILDWLTDRWYGLLAGIQSVIVAITGSIKMFSADLRAGFMDATESTRIYEETVAQLKEISGKAYADMARETKAGLDKSKAEHEAFSRDVTAGWVSGQEEMLTESERILRGLLQIYQQSGADVSNTVTTWAQDIENKYREMTTAILNSAQEMVSPFQQAIETLAQVQIDSGQKILDIQYDFNKRAADLTADFNRIKNQLTKRGELDKLAIITEQYNKQMAAIRWLRDNSVKVEQNRIQTIIKQKKMEAAALLTFEVLRAKDYLNIVIKSSSAAAKAQAIANLEAMNSYRKLAAVKSLYAAGILEDSAYAAIIFSSIAEGLGGAISAAEAAVDAALGNYQIELQMSEVATASLSDELAELGGAAGSAGSAVSTQLIDPIEEATRDIAAMAGMVDKAMEAFAKLADFHLEIPDWVGGWNRLKEAIAKVLMEMAQLVKDLGFKAEDFTGIQNVANSFSAAIAPITRALEAIKALADAADLPDVRGKFKELAKQLSDFVTMLADDTLVGTELQLKAGHFADAVSKVVSIVKGGIDAVNELARFRPRGNITAGAVALRDALMVIVDAFGEVVADARASGRASAFAEVVSKIVSPIKNGIEALSELAKARIVTVDVGRLTALVNSLKEMLDVFNVAIDQDVIDAASAFADVAGKVIAPIKSALDAMADLAKMEKVGDLKTRITDVVLFIRDVVSTMAKALAVGREGSLDDVVDAAAEFASKVGPIISALKSAVDLRNAFANWVEDIGDIGAHVGEIAAFLRTIVKKLVKATSMVSDDMLEAAKNFAEKVGPILNAIKSAFDLRQAFATWTDLAGDVGAKIDVLVAVLGLVAIKLNKATDEIKGWLKPLTEAAADFLKAIGPTLTILKATMDFRNALGTWENELVGKVSARIDVLVSVLGLIAIKLNVATEKVGDWFAPLTEAAANFIKAIGPAIEIIKHTLDFRNALEEWSQTIVGKVEKRINVLISIMGTVAVLLNQAASEAGRWQQPLSEAAQNFVKALGPAMEILDKTLDFRNALGTWEQDLKGKVERRIDVLISIMGTIAVKLNRAADEAKGWLKPLTDAAANFLAAIGPAIDALRNVLDLRNALGEWSHAVDFKVEKRIDVLISMLGTIAVKLNKAADEAKGWLKPLTEAARNFLAAIGPALDVLRNVLDLRNVLGEWSHAVDFKVEARLDVLISIMGFITAKMNEAAAEAGRWGDPLSEAADNFIKAIGPALDALKSTLDLRNALKEWAEITDEEINARLDELIRVLGDVATEFNSAVLPEITDATITFSERIQTLVSALSSAIGFLKDLAELVIPRDVQTSTENLVEAMKVIIETVDRLLTDLGLAMDDAGNVIDPLRDKFEQWAARMKPLAEIIQSSVGILTSLTEVEIPTSPYMAAAKVMAGIINVISGVNRFLKDLHLAIDEATGEVIDPLRDKFEQWAARIKPLAEIIQSSVGTLAALVDIKMPISPWMAARKITAGIINVFLALKGLLPEIELNKDKLDEIAERLKLWAARVQAIATIISSGVDALNKLRDYKAGGLIFLQRFVDDLVVVVKAIDEKLKGKVSEELQKIGERLTALFGGIVQSVQGMAALRAYKNLLPVWVDKFVEDLDLVVARLSDIRVSQDVVDKMQALQAIFGPVTDVVQGLASLRAYKSLLPIWVDRFVEDVQIVLAKLAAISGYGEGFVLGRQFAEGFLAAWLATVGTLPVSPVQPGGIPAPFGAGSGGTTIYNYGTIQAHVTPTGNSNFLTAMEQAVRRA